MLTTTLIPTLALALCSLLCTIFVLLRIVSSTLPAQSLTSPTSASARLANVRASGESTRSSLTLVERAFNTWPRRDVDGAHQSMRPRLHSAQRLLAYVAVADQASLAIL